MQLKLLKSFSSKTMFRGREFDLKFCTTQKRRAYFKHNLFRGKMLIHYRKEEFLEK